MSTLAALLAAIGGLVTAVGSIWMGYMKSRSDTQAAKGSRIDIMENRLDKMQVDLDMERTKRVSAETLAHRLRLALITMIDYVEEISKWADGGSKPPPPAAPELKTIKHLIEG